MYTYNEIKLLHIELSSNCQASCPMCARNNHGGLSNPLLKVEDIDLLLFKKIAPSAFIQQLEGVTMCGNFGDPILNKELIPIVEYITLSNPYIRIDLHTNGGARNAQWWTELATAMPRNGTVQFGIDGLEDTHALYRVGTDFNKIIENARAFIAAGGAARWNFITFKHNEHQLEQCRQLANELGFKSFYEKQTSRFIGKPYFEVLDKTGAVTHTLESPTTQKIIFIDRKTVENYKEIFKEAVIECEVEHTKSVFVDALGYVWPCCFVAAVPYIHATPEKLVYDFLNDSRTSLAAVLEKFGGIEQFNIRNRSIEEIVNSTEWQSVWDETFIENSLRACTRTCGKFPEPTISQCRDQFLDLKEF